MTLFPGKTIANEVRGIVSDALLDSGLSPLK